MVSKSRFKGARSVEARDLHAKFLDAYLARTHVRERLHAAVEALVCEQPDNPYLFLSEYLRSAGWR